MFSTGLMQRPVTRNSCQVVSRRQATWRGNLSSETRYHSQPLNKAELSRCFVIPVPSLLYFLTVHNANTNRTYSRIPLYATFHCLSLSLSLSFSCFRTYSPARVNPASTNGLTKSCHCGRRPVSNLLYIKLSLSKVTSNAPVMT